MHTRIVFARREAADVSRRILPTQSTGPTDVGGYSGMNEAASAPLAEDANGLSQQKQVFAAKPLRFLSRNYAVAKAVTVWK